MKVLASILALALGLAGCAGTAAPSASVPEATPSESSPSIAPVQSAVTAEPVASVAASATPAAARLARNGVIVYNDAAGDIHTVDPETGKTTLLIGGADNDIGPWFAPDGRHFVFLRLNEATVYIANADGG